MKQFFTDKELKNSLESIHEKSFIELKKASQLPKSFWESYSAFCNTSGGWIILGVEEAKPKNIIHTIENADKMIADIWNQLSNDNKVNYRSIENRDINKYEIDGKTIIIVKVNEAPEFQKPVYINGKIENTYIRTGDGDRKAKETELASFYRNAQPCQDTLVAEGITIDDLDMDSVISFKERTHKRYPKKKYISMTNEEFLVEIGACVINRETGKHMIKKGTLLFLGKCNSIKEIFPRYHVDFYNKRGNNSRWLDRVSDDEPGDYEMNLYNFFSIVNEKIRLLLNESFALDENQIRKPNSNFNEPVRECLVNCLAHADYIQAYTSTKIEVYDGWISFENPGKMLISKEQFAAGGDSRPRNEIIMKMFRLLGASERQGFGGPLIFKTAIKNDFRKPEVFSDLEATSVCIWNIDLADSYPDLAIAEKNVLRLISKSGSKQSINSIKKELGYSEYSVRKITSRLEEKKLIKKTGSGPSTGYIVAIGNIELLTMLQITIESIKSQMR